MKSRVSLDGLLGILAVFVESLYAVKEGRSFGRPNLQRNSGEAASLHASTATDLILCANDENTSATPLCTIESPSVYIESGEVITELLQNQKGLLSIPANTYNVIVPRKVAEPLADR